MLWVRVGRAGEWVGREGRSGAECGLTLTMVNLKSPGSPAEAATSQPLGTRGDGAHRHVGAAALARALAVAGLGAPLSNPLPVGQRRSVKTAGAARRSNAALAVKVVVRKCLERAVPEKAAVLGVDKVVLCAGGRMEERSRAVLKGGAAAPVQLPGALRHDRRRGQRRPNTPARACWN